MVRALLDGKKTQTRRILPHTLSRAKPGDLIWVRERFARPHGGSIFYFDSDPHGLDWKSPRRMPKNYSRITLEITEIRRQKIGAISDDDVIAEGFKVWGGGERDANGVWHRLVHGKKPGTENEGLLAPEAFSAYWAHINGAKSWNTNPDVVCATFTVHKINIEDKLF